MNKTFPNLEEFKRTVIHPRDLSNPGKIIIEPENIYHKYYKDKYRIAQCYQPVRIAELGVRYGYSAYSFLLGSDNVELYHGYDIIDGEGGAEHADAHEYASQLISQFNIPFDIENVNTQEIDELIPKFDFIHVDADHSFKGCLHDLELAWHASTKLIVVDDYDHIESVANATAIFINLHKDEIDRVDHWYTFRGDIVIHKKAV